MTGLRSSVLTSRLHSFAIYNLPLRFWIYVYPNHGLSLHLATNDQYFSASSYIHLAGNTIFLGYFCFCFLNFNFQQYPDGFWFKTSSNPLSLAHFSTYVSTRIWEVCQDAKRLFLLLVITYFCFKAVLYITLYPFPYPYFPFFIFVWPVRQLAFILVYRSFWEKKRGRDSKSNSRLGLDWFYLSARHYNFWACRHHHHHHHCWACLFSCFQYFGLFWFGYLIRENVFVFFEYFFFRKEKEGTRLLEKFLLGSSADLS